MTENALSILIIFPHNSNKPRPRTESCVFSDLVIMLLFSNFHIGPPPFLWLWTLAIQSTDPVNKNKLSMFINCIHF